VARSKLAPKSRLPVVLFDRYEQRHLQIKAGQQDHREHLQSAQPWAWIPSLYFSQGIPYVIVMTMSVVMYKRLGISNTDIALYTSLLYVPWVIKPLWSPFVDITRTKRFWIVAMQFLVSFGLTLVAFSVQGSHFFKMSLILFWIMAFASSTHDIAADGFYMLSLSKHEQAWWSGCAAPFTGGNDRGQRPAGGAGGRAREQERVATGLRHRPGRRHRGVRPFDTRPRHPGGSERPYGGRGRTGITPNPSREAADIERMRQIMAEAKAWNACMALWRKSA